MISSFSPEAAELLKTLPPIRRARNWRLYGSDGKRYLDMYADGGRTILGRKTGRSGTVAKASVDMGLVSSFPSFWECRLRKAIKDMWPGYAGIRFFNSEAEALCALAEIHGDFSSLPGNSTSLFETLHSFEKTTLFESPFREYRTDLAKDPTSFAFGGAFAIGILPLAPAWSFGIVLAREVADLERLAIALPPCSPVPPVKLAVAVRSLADFPTFATGYCEAHWSSIDPFMGAVFKRSGPWLYPAYPKVDHGRVFASCLAKGIFISPEYEQPSLIPGEFDKGEVAPLRSITI